MNRKALGLVLLASATSFVVASAALVPSTQTPSKQVVGTQNNVDEVLVDEVLVGATFTAGVWVLDKRPLTEVTTIDRPVDENPPEGTLTIIRPLENEVTTLDVIKADAPSADGTTTYFGRTEWYPEGSEKASSFNTLITLGGAGVKPTATFTRVDRNTMLVGSDNNALKITFTGKENKMLTAMVENVELGKVVMVVTAKGNWEIADASRFSRSLPALIAALSEEVGTKCDPSESQARSGAKSLCTPYAVKSLEYSCKHGNVTVKTECATGPGPAPGPPPGTP
jgi:hypothetical protein